MENGFKYNGPVIINIFTDPNALAMPPAINFDQMKGFAESMAKLMVNGKFADIVDTTKSELKYLLAKSQLEQFCYVLLTMSNFFIGK